MALHGLTLSAIPGAWRLFAARKADPAFLDFCQQVWKRDNYVCQFCGFQARIYQEVVNLDGNYNQTKLSNTATSCCFCTQCFFLEAVGQSNYGGGTLIYLPEIDQASLNGLCHVLFCAIANATAYRADAQEIYRTLKARSQIVEEELGEGMSNPGLIGQLLIDASAEDYATVQNKILVHLRLLPSRTKFSEQIEAWAAAALEELSSSDEE